MVSNPQIHFDLPVVLCGMEDHHLVAQSFPPNTTETKVSTWDDINKDDYVFGMVDDSLRVILYQEIIRISASSLNIPVQGKTC